MSRSRKRTPIYKDGSGNPSKRWAKRQASRRVRQWKGSSREQGYYRKLFEPWDICDYSVYLPWWQAKKEGWSKGFWKTGGWTRCEWEKVYYRK